MRVLFGISMHNMPCVLCLARVRITGEAHLHISHSQQEHTAGNVRDRFKPGMIQEASYPKKWSGVQSWVTAFLHYEGRRAGRNVHHMDMALLCLAASSFGTKWVQPGPLWDVLLHLIAGALEGPVWSFLAPLQQVLKPDEEAYWPKDTGIHGRCPPGGWICE